MPGIIYLKFLPQKKGQGRDMGLTISNPDKNKYNIFQMLF